MTEHVEATALAAVEQAGTLAALAESHYPWVRRMCTALAGNADEGQELAQEVMALACEHFSTLHDPQAFRPWVRVVARHKFISWLRRRRKEQGIMTTAASAAVVAAGDSPGRDLDLEAAVARLPGEQRTALVLHYFLGLRYREIAAVMSCPIGTVMSRLAAARAKLHRELANETGGGELG